MKRLFVSLKLRTVTTKVSDDAWERIKELREKFGYRQQDILSVCIMIPSDEEILRRLKEHEEALAALSKPTQAVLKNIDEITDEEREILRDALS